MKVAKITKWAVEGESEKTALDGTAGLGGGCKWFSEHPFSPCPPPSTASGSPE